MKASCKRWAALEDRRAVGEPLSEAEEAFAAKHVRECEACAREATFWQSLADVDVEGARSGGGDPPRDVVERIVVRHERSRHAAGRPAPAGRGVGPRAVTIALAAAGALALAASVILVVRRGREPSAGTLVIGRARVSSGDAEIDGHRARAGDALLAGQTIRARDRVCLELELAVRACLEPGSEASLEDAATAHRVVALRRGHLSATLAHQPAGTTFGISTPRGTATAVGTSFSVDVPDPSGPVRVRVETGIVAVVAPGGASVRVQAGEETVMGTSVVTKSAVDAEDRIPVAPPPPPSLAAAPSSPSAATVPGPISAPIPPPSHAASAGELLQRARALRGSGRFREAASVYQELEASHPESAEARASLVSLGEVELSQLGEPARALRAFDEYLTTGGVLSEEAEYDRIRALGALGRDGEARAATERFVVRYPSSLHTPTLQSRLRPADAAP